jgi:outer membrane receptor protein involved in Fe transport
MIYNDTHYLRFPNASCYLGQTIAGGCSVDNFGQGGFQDLSGQTVSEAPKFAGNIGADYTWDLNDKYTAGVRGTVRYTSSYHADTNLDPLGRVGGFTLFDAGLQIARRDHLWELALICRDCTNKVYVVNGTDGSAIPPAVIEDIGRPRQILLQFTTRPTLW